MANLVDFSPNTNFWGLSHPPFFLCSVLPSGKFLKKNNQRLETCYRNLAILILIFQHMVNFKDHFYHRNPLHVSKSHFEGQINAKFLHPKRKLSQRHRDIQGHGLY
jgi:hypothetical protein